MNLHDKAQQLSEREKKKLVKHFRQWQEALGRDDEALKRLDRLIHKAEEAEQEMNKPITS